MPNSEPRSGVAARLARTLPDIPRWIETRSMLLSEECEVFGPEEGSSDFVVRDEELISVVGYPSWEAIRSAASRGAVDLLAFSENRDHVSSALPGWTDVRAILHLLGDSSRLPAVPENSIRWLAESEIDAVGSESLELRSELELAFKESPIVASLEEGSPVSFCYASSQTEGLWDIAIDTLESHWRRGHASRCVAYMIEYMTPLRPVWAAEEINAASLGLAARLGFVPVDELTIFHPPTGAEAALR